MKKVNLDKSIKVVGSVFNVIVYLFLMVAILLSGFVALNKSAKQEGVMLFGYQFRTVLTNSMAESQFSDVDEYKIKSFSSNTMLVINTVPKDQEERNSWYKALKVGDVLTFKYVYVRQETITHRITKITEKANGGFVIELRGDNEVARSRASTQVIDTSLVDSPNYVIGKVVKTSYPLGYLVTQLQRPIVMVVSIIVPTCAVILFEFAKLIKIKNVREVKKLKDRLKEKEKEIEILRKKLKIA